MQSTASAADNKTAAPTPKPNGITTLKWLKQNDKPLAEDKSWNALTSKYESYIASDAVVEKTRAALAERKHKVSVVDSPAAALALLTSAEALPKGASVAFGGSITLEEIGLIDAVKARTDLRNYRAEALAAMATGDMPKSMGLRFEGARNADLFFSSLNALTETGDLITADASGTRVSAMTSGAKQVVLVVGANKIVPDLAAGLARLTDWVVPVEGAHMRDAYKLPGTSLFNITVTKGSFQPRFHVVIVKGHSLGY